VEFLKSHPRIEKVIFPFDKTFPQYDLAKRQMKEACGLVTIVLRVASRHEVVRFCESLQHIRMAVSWGGHESLAIPRCCGIPAADFDASNPTHRYIRLYFGLEDADFIIADLKQALGK
jgi:cystathionine beta-lyase/cystathionine gamma-synthase